MKHCAAALLFFAAFVFAVSCSSAPKRPVEIFTERNMASSQLDLANSTANQGLYEDALLILADARAAAVRVDDPPLLVKTLVSRGNILFALGRRTEAFADYDAALVEAGLANETELAALVRIFMARGRLVMLGETDAREESVRAIRDEAAALAESLKNDEAAKAAGLVVLALAEKELGNYAEAENAAKAALALHEKARYLEEAAYDWYLVASIYSVSGRYDDALAALREAIVFDRRAENAFGIASSWQAMGDVYTRMNRPADAGACFNRAAAIFRAAGLEDRARKAEERAAGQ